MLNHKMEKDKDLGAVTCDHKFIHKDTDKFYFFSGRNFVTYKMVSFYFCERCLEEKEIIKQESFPSTEVHKIPDWAKTITKKVAGYE